MKVGSAGNMQQGSVPSARDLESEKLLKACQEFESVMMEQMLKAMRSTVPKSELEGSFGQDMTQEMYDEQLSKEMSKSGGVGLAEVLYRQLSREAAENGKKP